MAEDTGTEDTGTEGTGNTVVRNTVVSVDRVINAPASALFAVVADATRHPEIDGSGQLVKAKDGAPHQLTMGSTFGMSMKMGVPYSMSNTVVEFEPVEGGTKVTESWDISRDKQAFLLKHHRVGQSTAAAMSKTLDRLAEITES